MHHLLRGQNGPIWVLTIIIIAVSHIWYHFRFRLDLTALLGEDIITHRKRVPGNLHENRELSKTKVASKYRISDNNASSALVSEKFNICIKLSLENVERGQLI